MVLRHALARPPEGHTLVLVIRLRGSRTLGESTTAREGGVSAWIRHGVGLQRSDARQRTT